MLVHYKGYSTLSRCTAVLLVHAYVLGVTFFHPEVVGGIGMLICTSKNANW